MTKFSCCSLKFLVDKEEEKNAQKIRENVEVDKKKCLRNIWMVPIATWSWPIENEIQETSSWTHFKRKKVKNKKRSPNAESYSNKIFSWCGWLRRTISVWTLSPLDSFEWERWVIFYIKLKDVVFRISLINSQYFWKWTNANPMRFFSRAATIIVGGYILL